MLSQKSSISSATGAQYIMTYMQAAELEKVQTKLGKWTAAQLNSLLDLLDLSRGSGEEGLKVRMPVQSHIATLNESQKTESSGFRESFSHSNWIISLMAA